MENFYIITNDSKDQSGEITQEIKSYLEEKGRSCVLEQKDGEGNVLVGTVPKDLDCVIVIGGDGTLIQAARDLIAFDLPLLGVNMGTLGYLAEIEVQNIRSAIDQLLDEKPMIEERMMLKGALPDGREVRALNDVVVTRLGSLRTVRFNLFVNGELLNCYQADGIIISTPTGSTAYNLSAGGPIVEPQASLIVVTPICSHALNASSIVLSSESEIVIEIGEGKNGGTEIAGITFDGCEMTELRTGEQVYIRKAEEKTKFLRLSKISFLEILHRKMKGN